MGYILQPLTHKIKRASARSSHTCLLPYPLLPLRSMLRVAKLFPFGGGVIKHVLISSTLIPGVTGDCMLPLVCELFLHMYCSKVAKMIPSTVSYPISSVPGSLQEAPHGAHVRPLPRCRQISDLSASHRVSCMAAHVRTMSIYHT